jgi:hypothetical protein
MVFLERYMVEGGEFRAQKRCGSKPLSTAPKSHAYSTPNPIEAHGRPLVMNPFTDPEEKSVNEQGLVVETLVHSINEKHGGFVHGDKNVSPNPFVWISVATHLFQLAQNSFLTFLAIYYF